MPDGLIILEVDDIMK